MHTTRVTRTLALAGFAPAGKFGHRWISGSRRRAISSPLAVVALLFSAATALWSQGTPVYTYSVLHTFTGALDGSNPYAGLVRDKEGNLYGTTAGGGNSSSPPPPYPACGANTPGCGVVFKVDPKARETILYNFTGGADGGSNANIAIGYEAGEGITSTNGNIDIGNTGINGDSGVTRIGSSQTGAFISGVYGVTPSGAVEVVINGYGQLGTISSSRRYKEDIRDMGDASNGLMSLRPVSFRYKKPFNDGSQPIQYGLIAEEVAEVYPDLVARSTDGQIETVNYQVLGPMLLNELQKQSTTIAAQKEQIQAQEQQIRPLEERLGRVEAALQQISVSAPSR